MKVLPVKERSVCIISLCVALAGCQATGSRWVAMDDLKPQLLAPIVFKDLSVTGYISPEGVQRLAFEKLQSSQEDAYEFLAHPDSEVYVRTETVDQYRKALAQGCRARTTFDITTESWFIDASQVLKFMEKARPAKTNCLAGFSLKNLPVGFLNWSGSGERETLQKAVRSGARLSDYAAAGKIGNLKAQGERIEFDFKGIHYIVSKKACGDVDEDGFADLLISIAWYYREGSGRGYETEVIAGFPAPRRN